MGGDDVDVLKSGAAPPSDKILSPLAPGQVGYQITLGPNRILVPRPPPSHLRPAQNLTGAKILLEQTSSTSVIKSESLILESAMGSRFYFGDSDTSSNVSEDNLPYPTPLPRSSFLTPDFDPTTYLSTLNNRHQTLEDLRTELRTRSQDLSKELIDLVNTNYNDFLSLGSSLDGGEEKVEEVRVGLLAFRKDVEGLKKRVSGRREEVNRLINERRALKRQMCSGKTLLEIADTMEELESQLMVDSDRKTNGLGPNGDTDTAPSDSEEDSDEDDQDDSYISVSRLQRQARQFLLIEHLISKVGRDHPYLVSQKSRMLRIRNTILLDLGTALKQSTEVKPQNHNRVLRLMAIYREMGDYPEAVRVLGKKRA